MKKGKIIPNGILLEKHELATVLYFTDKGYNIELIPPRNSPGNQTPDFIMNGKAWEMKSPQGKSKNTIEHLLKKAKRQSENVIIDLSRSRLNEEIAINEIKRRFKQTKSCRRLKIITKNRALLEFEK